MTERKITTEDVERAVDDLRDRGLFADTGPTQDGRRTAEQWLNAMREDAAIAQLQLEQTLLGEGQEDKALHLAQALKEVRRLESDFYRFAIEVHGIGRDVIDR